MVAGNADFDTLAATTLEEWTKSLVNNIFEEQPFLFMMQQGDRLRYHGGGRTMAQPLIYDTNDTVASYSQYDTIATTAQAGITAAEYPVRQMAGTVTIDGYTQAVNSGPQEIVDLLEAKMMQLRESFADTLNQQAIQSDGTGNTNKDWHGLEYLVGNEVSSVTTVGGIDATDANNTWWRSHIVTAVGSLTLGAIANAYNTIAKGTDKPDIGLTTQTVYEAYEALLQPQQRFADPKTADAGFDNLLYRGMPVTVDDYVNSGDFYMVNTKYLKLRPHTNRWMTPTEFVRPYNQDAIFAQVLSYGNFTISNRKRQARLEGVTA